MSSNFLYAYAVLGDGGFAFALLFEEIMPGKGGLSAFLLDKQNESCYNMKAIDWKIAPCSVKRQGHKSKRRCNKNDQQV